MKKKLLLIICMLCISQNGCSGPSKPPESPFCRVVTEVSIQVENAAEPGQRRYVDSEKMTKALNYLRWLEPWDRPMEAPEDNPGAHYDITLHFSDGSTKHYEQIAYEYFREPGSSWRRISPEDGVRLALLLAAVPTDTI